MHINKVKERLSELARISEEGAKLHPSDKDMFLTDKEALETALNYIKNSISKDKIKDCLEDIEDYFENVSVPYEDIEFIKEKRNDLLKEE